MTDAEYRVKEFLGLASTSSALSSDPMLTIGTAKLNKMDLWEILNTIGSLRLNNENLSDACRDYQIRLEPLELVRCSHEAYHGQCAHCGVQIKNGRAVA